MGIEGARASRARKIALFGTVAAAVLTVGAALAAEAVSQNRAANADTSGKTFYSPAQAERGEAIYKQHCVTCHGPTLQGNGELGPPLVGGRFDEKWGGAAVSDVLTFVETTMPPGSPKIVNHDSYRDVLAYIFRERKLPAGPDLSSNMKTLAQTFLPRPADMHSSRVTPFLADPHPAANPINKLTPVTDDALLNPAPEDWLTWRRGANSNGYSPLNQVNAGNVKDLRLSWSWALGLGASQVPPLVHDGVMYVHSNPDTIQALNAANGDLLWQFARPPVQGVGFAYKKGIVLYDNLLVYATTDMHVIALDAKTGKPVWDYTTANLPKFRFQINGSPVAAKGKIVFGTTGGSAPGGNYLIALDAKTGKEAWRFNTIPKPGEANGDTWNGQDWEKRVGGSIWTGGSFDSKLNAVIFGIAQTYDSAPLRAPQPKPMNDDALYTDASVALDIDTGKMKWFYQHMKSDQWDFDWAFEQPIFELPVNGKMERLTYTVGKLGVLDALRVEDGKYMFSRDVGFQNLIESIDPKTGEKKIRKGLSPKDKRDLNDRKARLICPFAGGVKPWFPTAYNPNSKVIFFPLIERCMDFFPVDPGEPSWVTSGFNMTQRPHPDTDGNYGRVQAINMETGKTLWSTRQHAPMNTGVLSTAGGLVFAGSLDRVFSAYNDQTGERLWRTRLANLPSASPVTYAVNGKQYVAIISGGTGLGTISIMSVVPDLASPKDGGSQVTVFELP